ncbi:PREDICTED: ankyrin repeat and zinc finger domain-containing protein 1-like [Amphimedon queenslandica]|uniref:VLRF1 domain-containing protein n=1 Tax=Amphimedon queenslandica TaxID=400682 RepID=A0A1X7VDY9_AMPQE|nr:PREDICTED: ankyrin repeat and zinc finger domain-containing protein 1-like [Amphimedon queenslandica]|eukprot:XP_019849233.1 PREDICTED: ankyrin repeat and zinc finger domain-containing protein 1-like [Amphimedon queenslandica]
MEQLKGTRKRLSLFSKEAKTILTEAASSYSLLTSDQSPDQLGDLSVKEIEKEEVEEEATNSVQCSSCHVTFSDREEQVLHYQLDWHRHNLKRKLKGLAPPLSQDDFEHLSGDLSSISGSDDTSSESEEQEGDTPIATVATSGSPLLTFTVTGREDLKETCAIYKTILINKKDETVSSSEVMENLVRLATEPQIWIVLMKSGGHFAGAIFKNSVVLEHKTFHRYTVRAKRGTVQSSRDSHQGGHKPRSAGASLRRYNEAALEQEIESLLLSWKEHFKMASAIFTRAPRHIKNPFSSTSKNSPILPGDQRVKSIPFATRRPTLHQVKLVHQTLSTLYCGLSPPPITTSTKNTGTKNTGTKITGTKNACVKETHVAHSKCVAESSGITCTNEVVTNEEVIGDGEDEEIDQNEDLLLKTKKRRRRKKVEKKVELVDPLVERLHTLCHGNDMESLVTMLRDNNVHSLTDVSSTSETHSPDTQSTSDPLLDINATISDSTCLHVASSLGLIDILTVLMEHGADPTIKDGNGKTPYEIAMDRQTRDAFRRFMNQWPQAHDYNSAQIPCPLTGEMEAVRRGKKAEKRRQQKKAQKDKKKAESLSKEMKATEESQANAAVNLSEREKRALAAEKRMAALADIDLTKYGKCDWCSSTLCGVVPFERLQHKYCSIDCVREHRTFLSEQKLEK